MRSAVGADGYAIPGYRHPLFPSDGTSGGGQNSIAHRRLMGQIFIV
jgi:hypothetical protein